MNKTLLLIICDFLLLNLLALTRWEKAEPTRMQRTPAQGAAPAQAPAQNQDMVDLMKVSLADEQAAREKLAQQLQTTQSNLQTREQNLAQLQTQSTALETKLNQTAKGAEELTNKLTASERDAAMARERLEAMQRELTERQKEAERQKAELAALSQQQAEARKKIESLNVAVQVSEQEKGLLRGNLDEAKKAVEVERQERVKIQQQTGELAQGVGKLAENSGALTKEIRDNRPINVNVLYNDFLANQVQTTFQAVRPGLFGNVDRSRDSKTVLLTDGEKVYGLIHANDTPFNLTDPTIGADWSKITVTLSRPPSMLKVSAVDFLAQDPRVIVLALDPAQAASFGVKIYQTAVDPFKFQDAVLVSATGNGYGEIPFKLDPTTPEYVRMDTHFFKRLFGNFSPSAGDLVFSRTGELLGIMVNREYCAVVKNFGAVTSIATGEDTTKQKTSGTLNQLAARIQAMPLRLQ